MDFKLKLSDIIKYLGLGVSVLITCLFVYRYLPDETKTTVSNVLSNLNVDKIASLLDFALPILALVLTYIVGLIVQTLFRLIYGDGYNAMSINEYCFFVQKFGKAFSTEFPSWVYWSYKPDKVVLEITDQTELKLKSETRSEWLILNQLFQGLHFIFLVSLVVGFFFVEPQWLRYAFLALVVSLWISSRWIVQKPVVSIVLTALQFLLLCASSCFLLEEQTMSGQSDQISYTLFAVLTGGLVLTFFCARFFAKKHILSIGNVASTDRESLDKILVEKGLPTAYILIRTNSGEYIADTIRSIASQTYPNIKVIILEDKYRKFDDPSKDSGDIYSLVTKANDASEGRRKLNILCYKSDKTGPYDLSMEIRNIYLNYSTDNDISIIIDSDDLFASDNVVQEIVTRMYRTQSDICLTGFEAFGRMSLNYSKNYHNILVKEIADLRFSLRYCLWDRLFHSRLLNEMYLVSTIGWVKCYRRPVMVRYKELLDKYGHPYIKDVYKDLYEKDACMVKYYDDNKHDNKHDNKRKEILDKERISKYEDFPDVLCLLMKDMKLTAIPKPSHMFRKEEGSVTTRVSKSNYDMHIPAFLSMTFDMYAKALADAKNREWQFIDDAQSIILDKFMVYKYIQYLDVVVRKNRDPKPEENLDYTPEDFAQRMSGIITYLKSRNADLAGMNDYEWTESIYKAACKEIESRNIIDFKYPDDVEKQFKCKK